MNQPETPKPDGTSGQRLTPKTQSDGDAIEKEILNTPLSPDEKWEQPVDWQFLAFALLGATILMVLMMI